MGIQKSKIGILSAFAAAAILGNNASFRGQPDGLERDESRQRRNPIIPKQPDGTKEYFFNANGDFVHRHMLVSECVYKCFARDDKNAIRKFKNFMKNA